MLNEGGDVYSMIEDKVLADRTMYDDLTVIYLAAVQTTQISVNNLMKYLHMDANTAVLEKLVQEVDSLLAFDVWDASGSHVNHEALREACSYENIQDGFDYTMMCFRESMRIEPPVGLTTAHKVIKDAVLARGTAKELKVRAGDEIHLMNTILHHDDAQWGANHNEFIPERFDSNSKYFMAPDGKHRHPYSYAPFLGGHRICLGKTFAENVAKRMISMVLKFYALEHADAEMKQETFAYDLFQIKLPSIHYKFAKRLPR